MKLFVLILLFGFSTPEKLNRGYLPPPGANFAGGSPIDLQTPLEYPKESPHFAVEPRNGVIVDTFKNNEYLPSVKTGAGFLGEENTENPAIGLEVEKNTHGFNPDVIETTVSPSSGDYAEYVPLLTTILQDKAKKSAITNKNDGTGTQNDILIFPSDKQNINYGIKHFSFGKPGNMPITAVSNDIIQNYQPKYFGMYGGNPMIIKSNTKKLQEDLENTFENINTNSVNYHMSAKDIPSKDTSKGFGTQKPDDNISITSTPLSTRNRTYLSTKYNPINEISGTSVNFTNKYRNFHESRPERLKTKADRKATIINNENVITPDGFAHSFATSNGIHKDESATTKDGVKAIGSYSYTGDDGNVYSVAYLADENGFQPSGDHLPTPPPIPRAIQMVIEQAKKDKDAGITHDGSYDEEKYGHMKYQGPIYRYLQKMRRKPHSKNPETKIPNDESHDNNNQNLDVQPVNNKGKFEKGRGPILSIHRGNMNKPIKDIINRRLMTSSNKQQERLRPTKPSTRNKFSLQGNNMPIKNKNKYSYNEDNGVSIRKVQNNMNRRNSFQNLGNIMSTFDDTTKMNKSNDAGYFYVPPRNMFIEGIFQDKIVLNETSKPSVATQENTEVTPVSLLRSNKIKGNYFITTTEESMNQQTYRSDFYESTNHNVSKSIDDTNLDTTENIVSSTTNHPNTPTNFYNQDIHNNAMQEDTILNVHKDETDYDMSVYSTTNPMPSKTKYINQLLGDEFYETTYPSVYNLQTDATKSPFDKVKTDIENVFPGNEGYFKKTPETPTLEYIPTSTYKPNANNNKKTNNINVDGFGRPIPDTRHDQHGDNDISPDVLDKENPRIYINNFGGLLDSTANPKIVDELLVVNEKAYVPIDFENATEKINGEDFSGPKQPQSYDPENGYFY